MFDISIIDLTSILTWQYLSKTYHLLRPSTRLKEAYSMPTEQKVLRKFRAIMSTGVKSYSILNIFASGSEPVLDLTCYNTFNRERNPGPVGQVRDDRLCHWSSPFKVSGVRFQVSVKIESWIPATDCVAAGGQHWWKKVHFMSDFDPAVRYLCVLAAGYTIGSGFKVLGSKVEGKRSKVEGQR